MNDLMRALSMGDEQAMQNFALTYGTQLFRSAFRLLKDESLAEDAVQELFIRIWQKAPLWNEKKRKRLPRHGYIKY